MVVSEAVSSTSGRTYDIGLMATRQVRRSKSPRRSRRHYGGEHRGMGCDVLGYRRLRIHRAEQSVRVAGCNLRQTLGIAQHQRIARHFSAALRLKASSGCRAGKTTHQRVSPHRHGDDAPESTSPANAKPASLQVVARSSHQLHQWRFKYPNADPGASSRHSASNADKGGLPMSPTARCAACSAGSLWHVP